MNDKTGSGFDAWLRKSNADLITATSQVLDIEAMLTSIRQDAATASRPRPDDADIKIDLVADSLTKTLALASARHEATGAGLFTDGSSTWLKGSLENEAMLVTNDSTSATERLLAAVRPLITRYCRAHIGRQNGTFTYADDVARDACLTLSSALPGYRDQGRPFLAFVYGLTTFKVAEAQRAARTRGMPVASTSHEPAAESGPEQVTRQGELTPRMKQLLDLLPKKQREVVVLRIFVGLSAEETAEALGTTPGAVRVAQHRALARLRAVLGTEDIR